MLRSPSSNGSLTSLDPSPPPPTKDQLPSAGAPNEPEPATAKNGSDGSSDLSELSSDAEGKAANASTPGSNSSADESESSREDSPPQPAPKPKRGRPRLAPSTIRRPRSSKPTSTSASQSTSKPSGRGTFNSTSAANNHTHSRQKSDTSSLASQSLHTGSSSGPVASSSLGIIFDSSDEEEEDEGVPETRSSRRHRKRSALVPGEMWAWAAKKAAKPKAPATETDEKEEAAEEEEDVKPDISLLRPKSISHSRKSSLAERERDHEQQPSSRSSPGLPLAEVAHSHVSRSPVNALPPTSTVSRRNTLTETPARAATTPVASSLDILAQFAATVEKVDDEIKIADVEMELEPEPADVASSDREYPPNPNENENEAQEDDEATSEEEEAPVINQPSILARTSQLIAHPEDSEDDEDPKDDENREESDEEDDEGPLLQKDVEQGTEEQEPEQEVEPEQEAENEILTSQRVEALDILAAMELKFALLRERIFLDKMNDVAREEKLLADGTHPEYLYLLAELQRRKDRKLLLASRWLDQEKAFAEHTRRVEDQVVWSRWDEAKDDVRDDLVADTNRKRRRLEREKRSLDHPRPARKVVVSAEPPVPRISVKETIRAQTSFYSSTTHARGAPGLRALTTDELSADLDALTGRIRKSPPRAPPPPMNGFTQQQFQPPPPPRSPYPPPQGYHPYPTPQQQQPRYQQPLGYGHVPDQQHQGPYMYGAEQPYEAGPPQGFYQPNGGPPPPPPHQYMPPAQHPAPYHHPHQPPHSQQPPPHPQQQNLHQPQPQYIAYRLQPREATPPLPPPPPPPPPPQQQQHQPNPNYPRGQHWGPPAGENPPREKVVIDLTTSTPEMVNRQPPPPPPPPQNGRMSSHGVRPPPKMDYRDEPNRMLPLPSLANQVPLPARSAPSPAFSSSTTPRPPSTLPNPNPNPSSPFTGRMNAAFGGAGGGPFRHSQSPTAPKRTVTPHDRYMNGSGTLPPITNVIPERAL